MNAPSGINLFELLNFCLQQHPEALGVFALNPRVHEVRMPRKPAPSGTCHHRRRGVLPPPTERMLALARRCEAGERRKEIAASEGVSYGRVTQLLEEAKRRLRRGDATHSAACATCGEEHPVAEKCSRCEKMIPYHEFPGREPRVTLLTVELPERVGQNLKGAEEDHAFLVAFSIDRAVCDSFVRRASSPIILPAGAMS